MALQDIYNFLPLSTALATSGQPTTEQFSEIAAANYQTVINLALPTSDNALSNEAGLVAGLGMQYVHIPVEFTDPQTNDFKKFIAAMQIHQEAQCWVHCAANMRVSAFMLLYRVTQLGMEYEVAQQDMLKIWQPDAVWEKFIHHILAH